MITALGIICAGLLVYVLALVIDYRSVSIALDKILRGEVVPVRSLLTTPGNKAMAIARCVNSAARNGFFADKEEGILDVNFDRPDLIRVILQYTVRGVSASAIALVKKTTDNFEITTPTELSSSHKKWICALDGLGLLTNEETFLPVDDKKIVGNSSSVGVGATLVMPVFPGIGELYHFVLLYPPGISPLELEKHRIKKIAQHLAVWLKTAQQVRALSGQVSTHKDVVAYKSKVLAQLMHDIRSPINNVKLILDMLANDITSADVPEMIGAANLNCQILSNIAAGLLDIYKLENGQLQTRGEKLQITSLLSQIIKGYSYLLSLKHLTLNVGQLSSSYVYADHNHLVRIICNLLSNAEKFTTSGGVTIDTTETDDFVTIAIADTGCGMSSEQQNKLFTPFARESRDIDGIGLGLSLSKALIELNNGEISCKSKSGAGTTFFVKIPKKVVGSQFVVDQAVC